MVIGYSISAHDNNSFYLEDEKLPDAPMCNDCGFLLDPINYFNPFFKIGKKTLDLSYTYDLRPIASLRLKEFCIREKYKGLDFKEFETEPNYFHLFVKNIVELDLERSQPEFEKLCGTCSNWEGIYKVGKRQFLKDISTEIKDGIYRTDLLFAHGNSKSPNFVIGIDTYKKLKREKIKGLVFDPLYL